MLLEPPRKFDCPQKYELYQGYRIPLLDHDEPMKFSYKSKALPDAPSALRT
jgi:hypothetical protein